MDADSLAENTPNFNEKRLHWASVVRAQMHPGQALKKLFLFSPSKIELSGEFFAHVTSLKNTAKQVATKSLQTFGCILHAYLIRCPKCGPWYSISRKNYVGFLGNGEVNSFSTIYIPILKTSHVLIQFDFQELFFQT